MIKEQQKSNTFLEKQNEQNAQIISLLQIIANDQKEPLVSLVNHLPREDLPRTAIEVALPSKDELAKKWFEEHPEDKKLTGRELESQRLPMGVKISYVTWNKIKKGMG